jgi:hypothetical protein
VVGEAYELRVVENPKNAFQRGQRVIWRFIVKYLPWRCSMENWKAGMQRRFVLPFLSIGFLAVSLSAQKPIPISAEHHLAAVARVNGMSASDVNAVVIKGARWRSRSSVFIGTCIRARPVAGKRLGSGT